MTIREIDTRLQALRDEYKDAASARRSTILLMARALNIAKEKLEEQEVQNT